MPSIECGRGHIYDTDLYTACPYCNRTTQLNGIPVTDSGRTVPLKDWTAANPARQSAPVSVTNDNKTQPPKGYAPTPRPAAGVSVTGENKTLPPRSYSPPAGVTEDNKTVAVSRAKLGVDPVVGWLVCIEGSDLGRDWRLLGQINTVGRSSKMDVSISGDKTVTDENHMRVAYSDRNNRFTLIPAESKNIVYLNGDEVFTPTELAAYDEIICGETKLLFVPFCGDKFDWAKKAAKEATDGAV